MREVSCWECEVGRKSCNFRNHDVAVHSSLPQRSLSGRYRFDLRSITAHTQRIVSVDHCEFRISQSVFNDVAFSFAFDAGFQWVNWKAFLVEYCNQQYQIHLIPIDRFPEWREILWGGNRLLN